MEVVKEVAMEEVDMEGIKVRAFCGLFKTSISFWR
jgi:hypothetical protein